MTDLFHRLQQRFGFAPKTGCIPSAADPNNYKLTKLLPNVGAVGAGALPERKSLRDAVVEVLNQANNDCVANAFASGVQLSRVLKGNTPALPSRRALYAWARILGGYDIKSDSGCQITAACKAARRFGLPCESDVPYSLPFNVKPPIEAYRSGYDTSSDVAKLKGYYELDGLLDVKRAIAANRPVLFAIDLLGDWSNKGPEYIQPTPRKKGQRKELHALLAVGYDSAGIEFLNSWGKGFRDGGFAWLPNQYFEDKAFDRFAIDVS